jgi:hypothetical protein
MAYPIRRKDHCCYYSGVISSTQGEVNPAVKQNQNSSFGKNTHILSPQKLRKIKTLYEVLLSTDLSV